MMNAMLICFGLSNFLFWMKLFFLFVICLIEYHIRNLKRNLLIYGLCEISKNLADSFTKGIIKENDSWCIEGGRAKDQQWISMHLSYPNGTCSSSYEGWVFWLLGSCNTLWCTTFWDNHLCECGGWPSSMWNFRLIFN